MRLRPAKAAIACGLCALSLALPHAAFAETLELIGDAQATAPKGEPIVPDTVVPDAYQYEYQKDGLAAFCHFGPNTYTGVEWGDAYGNKPVDEIYQLTQDMDAHTFVKALKDAGFTKLIVTAKHHDGFCIWDSAETEYDVGSTTGKIDVLEQISKACTDLDMDMGLYLSPWDVHDPSYGYFDKDGNPCPNDKSKDEKDYNQYYNKQLVEILGNPKYGNAGVFKEVWMDGAKGSGAKAQEYDFDLWFKTIQQYEGKAAAKPADCMLFGAGANTTVRWIGNEQGFANEETWAKSKVTNKAIDHKKISDFYTVGYADGNKWTVPEADARITSGWFWGEDKRTPKSMSQLADMYFRSVGHNATLLLNVPPNKDGQVDPAILKRVEEFGNAIKQTFDENLAQGATVKATNIRGNAQEFKPGNVVDGKHRMDQEGGDTYWSTNAGTSAGTLEIAFDGEKTFDVVSIEEAIQFGQRITRHKVEYLGEDQQWHTFSEGTTVGSKRLARQQPVTSTAIRVHVESDTGSPVVSEVGVYKAKGGFELPSPAPEGFKTVSVKDEAAFKTTGDWKTESGLAYVGGVNKVAEGAGRELEFSFHGTKAYVVGTVGEGAGGKATVYVDGVKQRVVDTSVGAAGKGKTIFTTNDLSNGDHTVKVVVESGKVAVECAHVIDNGGRGFVEFDTDYLEMHDDATYQMPLHRVGGSTGELTVQVSLQPGSAVQEDFDTVPKTVTFAPGETEKTVPITTKTNTKANGDLTFTVELSAQDGAPVAGVAGKTTVKILDTEAFGATKLGNLNNRAQTLKKEWYEEEGWSAFETALAEAKESAKNTADKPANGRAYRKLVMAENALKLKGAYTADAPFAFPGEADAAVDLEVERGSLVSQGGSGEMYRLGVKGEDWASGGAFVNSFDQGDKVLIPFYAERAGTYTVTATYRSGSESNKINWETKGLSRGFIDAGSVAAGAASASETRTVDFEMTVSRAGKGVLVLYADAGKCPNLDKLTIRAKELGDTEPEDPEPSVPTPPTDTETDGKVEVDKRPDGSTVTTVTRSDGSKKVTVETQDGTVSVVELDEKGEMESMRAMISSKDAKDGESLLPIDPIAVSKTADAPAIRIDMPVGGAAERPLSVTVPVARPQGSKTVDPGVVVMMVDAAGREIVVPKTAFGATGVVFGLEGDATIKVADRSVALPDVKQDDWFYRDVVPFATSRGILNGVETPSGRVFDGNGSTSRGMFVAMLSNLELGPKAEGDESFEDVDANAWYADAAAWAAENGLVSGVDTPAGKRFEGDAPVTREQVAVLLMRYAEFLGLDTSARVDVAFPDAGDVSEWADEAMSWAVAEGLFMGNDVTGKLNPLAGSTRAETATVLMRFINNIYG